MGWIGLDDTDSVEGGCTTWDFHLLQSYIEDSGYEIKSPRLVRLWPFAPDRTRGNAALSAEVIIAPEQEQEFKKILDRKTRYEDTSLLDSLEKEMGDTEEFFELNQVGVKTIHDSFEIGTDEYRTHCQGMTPGQPVLSFKLANKVIERTDIDLFANEDEIIDKYKKRYGENWREQLQRAVLRMKKEL